ncbi:MAG: gliding motility protein GldN [Paludibacteraceae bacterium]
MKKYKYIAAAATLILSLLNTSNAQEFYDSKSEQPLPFFNELGAVRIQTTEMDALADTIAVVRHRADDIVWSRTVYRVIDMRYKQNYQLYFPTRPTDRYRSLFRVMLDAIADGANVYRRNPRDIRPMYGETLNGAELSRVFAYDEEPYNNLLQVDTITGQRSVNMDQYMQYVKNQLKFLVQEVVFFDKHTSRLYSKIVAVAPLYALHPDNMENKETMAYFRNSVLCWVAFDELRPYLVKQVVVPNGNDTERLNYDDFFTQKLYYDYVLGDSNMYSRMLLEYVVEEPKLRTEQKRIETELMNFEQDLWEY